MRKTRRFAIGTGLLAMLGMSLATAHSQEKILVVQDEMPQVEVLQEFIETESDLAVEVVDQSHLPSDFNEFQAVIGFIHGRLEVETERAIIDYTKAGGRYICLHHSISSGKANNEYYFDFLGIQLDNPGQSSQPVEPGGGYGWYHSGDEGVTIQLVNLNPSHFIVSHKIDWEESIVYQPSDSPSVEREYPAITLRNTEAYMNHKFTDGRQKIVLCGMKYRDERNGELFMQDRAVWIKPQGEGEIVYLLPGERPSDYQHPKIAQMILNAAIWDSEKK